MISLISTLIRRCNQSILKEISPEYSLEGLMLKLKFQYYGSRCYYWDSRHWRTAHKKTNNCLVFPRNLTLCWALCIYIMPFPSQSHPVGTTFFILHICENLLKKYAMSCRQVNQLVKWKSCFFFFNIKWQEYSPPPPLALKFWNFTSLFVLLCWNSHYFQPFSYYSLKSFI